MTRHRSPDAHRYCAGCHHGYPDHTRTGGRPCAAPECGCTSLIYSKQPACRTCHHWAALHKSRSSSGTACSGIGCDCACWNGDWTSPLTAPTTATTVIITVTIRLDGEASRL